MCDTLGSIAGTIWIPLDPFPITATRCPCEIISLSAVQLAEVTYRVVTALVPRSTVHQVALEIVKPRNLGPFPIVQGSCCLDQNIRLICVCGRTFDILDLEIVNSVPQQVYVLLTCTFHFDCLSSQLASDICCFNLMYFIHPYFSATPFQYW
jgi:hypothetical protein